MSETERPGDVRTSPRLQRSTDDRMLAGVCGGLADFTGLDPVIFRVAFAVAAILGGAGLVAYVLAWLLIPDASEERSHAESLLGDRDVPRAAVIVIGVIAVLLLADSLDGPFRPHSGGGGLTLVILVAVGVWYFTRDGSSTSRPVPARPAPPAAPPADERVTTTTPTPSAFSPAGGRLVDAPVDRPDVTEATAVLDQTAVAPGPRTPPRPRPARSKLPALTFSGMLLVAGLVAAVHVAGVASMGIDTALALCLLVVAGGLLAGTWYGRGRVLIPLGLVLTVLTGVAAVADVPLAGGTGDRFWNPATAEDLRFEYRLAAGNGVLDLRELTMDGSTRRVEASIGAGELEVRLPPGTDVDLTARAGFGEVVVLGRETGGVDRTQRREIEGDDADGGRLELDLEVGMGRVEVTR